VPPSRRSPLLRPDLAATYDAFETPPRGAASCATCGEPRREYLAAVRARVRELDLPADDAIVELVLRHERQHAETMLQTLALARLDGWTPPSLVVASAAASPASGIDLVVVPAGSCRSVRRRTGCLRQRKAST